MMAAFPFEFCPPDSWPVGFGFRPTEEELITHYLQNKMLGNESLVQSIPVVDLYNHEPHQLPELSTFKSYNHEWFFFHPEPTKTKTKRTTSIGYWKSTGEDRKIKARGTNDVIGTRKILVFYKGKTPHGVRTRWILHEYRLQIQHTDLTHPYSYPYERSFKVCKLKENAQHVSTCESDQHDSSHLKRKATVRDIQAGASKFTDNESCSQDEVDRMISNFWYDDTANNQVLMGPVSPRYGQESGHFEMLGVSPRYSNESGHFEMLQSKGSSSDDGPTTRESLRQPKSRDLISFGSKQRKISLLSKVAAYFKAKEDSSYGQKNEAGNKCGCIHSKGRHRSIEPLGYVARAFLSIIISIIKIFIIIIFIIIVREVLWGGCTC